MLTLDELKERVSQNYDECLICDVLEVSALELLDAFEHKLIEKREKFDEYDDD